MVYYGLTHINWFWLVSCHYMATHPQTNGWLGIANDHVNSYSKCSRCSRIVLTTNQQCSYTTVNQQKKLWKFTQKHINVKSGLINSPLLINLLLPPKKMQFKNRWSPSMNKHPRLKNIQCWNPFFYPTFFISNSIYFHFLHFFYHHCYT